MCPCALRLCVPAHDALHPMPDLDLQPVAAAAFFIATCASFGQDPFQLLLSRDLKQRCALSLVVIGIAQRVALLQNLSKLLLAVDKVYAPPVVPIEIDQIKGIVE